MLNYRLSGSLLGSPEKRLGVEGCPEERLGVEGVIIEE